MRPNQAILYQIDDNDAQACEMKAAAIAAAAVESRPVRQSGFSTGVIAETNDKESRAVMQRSSHGMAGLLCRGCCASLRDAEVGRDQNWHSDGREAREFDQRH